MWMWTLALNVFLRRSGKLKELKDSLYILELSSKYLQNGSDLRATSHTRLRAHDYNNSSTLINGKGGAGPSSLHTTLEGTTGVCECKMDVKVHMDPYMALNRSRFTITWTIFKNHLLEVGRIQNRETRGTMNTHNCWFILLYHVWGPLWTKIHWSSIWLMA